MPKENKISPEVVIELTEEQILKIKPLYLKRESLNE